MKKLRIISRAVIYSRGKILLAKNRGEKFWYPPGGGWDFQNESIIDAAKREVIEEAGIRIKIIRLLYVQEFHPDAKSIFFEIFWLASPLVGEKLEKGHRDSDAHGQVESVKWFSRKELQNIKIFPERLKSTFWKKLRAIKQSEDPFIGIT